ncbi:cysteine-rich secretory protein 2-like isoform X1 [Centruroides sculpturatus]|uniref:cysteine-rich secretory protein 2-like isoform X1 n=2 Tax=Centruroides sculpturatus TaxID=218467 RepID=UPI000C6DFA25|nr:cysteine-rich secretory protein 2-like isoform X1 [Centruroides sculpturatus]
MKLCAFYIFIIIQRVKLEKILTFSYDKPTNFFRINSRYINSEMSKEEKKDVVHMHNLFRSLIEPPASDMKFLEWDEDLERLAKSWVSNCSLDYGIPKHIPKSIRDRIGQNIYKGKRYNVSKILSIWFAEKEYFRTRVNRCIKINGCSRYQVLAYSRAKEIGCARNDCRKTHFFVCFYYPKRDLLERTYQIGKPCSGCDRSDGGFCHKNLCISKPHCTVLNITCGCPLTCLNCGILHKNNCTCTCKNGWDTLDCSGNVVFSCNNKKFACGRSEEFRDKRYCSRDDQKVGKVYCRKMCEKCKIVDYNDLSNSCCEGKICENGYVLNTTGNACNCYLLCPGPYCGKFHYYHYDNSYVIYV